MVSRGVVVGAVVQVPRLKLFLRIGVGSRLPMVRRPRRRSSLKFEGLRLRRGKLREMPRAAITSLFRFPWFLRCAALGPSWSPLLATLGAVGRTTCAGHDGKPDHRAERVGPCRLSGVLNGDGKSDWAG